MLLGDVYGPIDLHPFDMFMLCIIHVVYNYIQYMPCFLIKIVN